MGKPIKQINAKIEPGLVSADRKKTPRPRLRAGILGCTGIVGQHFLRLLHHHPYFEIAGLFASERSRGKSWSDPAAGREALSLTVQEANAEAVLKSKLDLVFSTLPSTVAGPLESALAARGLAVFSNSSAHRLDGDVPLLIADVNPAHLLTLTRAARRRQGGFIVTNSNCCVSGLALAVRPLIRFGIRSLTVSTYQAISGAGRGGLAAWDISDNLIPHIGGEEEKINREMNKIFASPLAAVPNSEALPIQASCCRVPIRDGHLQSVVVDLERDVELPEIITALARYRSLPQRLKLPTAPHAPIIVRPETDRPQPKFDLMAGTPARAAGMAISVGRLRRHDPSGQPGRGIPGAPGGQPARLAFFLLVHNLIRGAAGGCLLNAELAWRLGYLQPRRIG